MAACHIYVVSDGTGETATKMSRAALAQFSSADAILTRHSNIRTPDAIRLVIEEAEKHKALIVHTFASKDLRRLMAQGCRERKIPNHDLLGQLFETLEEFLGLPAIQKAGLLHQLDDDYFERIDALAFTVRHDENRTPEELNKADIILIGISRTSKTPLAVYLAQEGWKVANIPVVMGETLPDELLHVDQSRIVGLISTPERLAEVRKARLSRLAATDSNYADIKRVKEELEYCKKIFAKHPEWLLVDVTGKSVEETASEILDKLFGRERRP